MDLVSIGVVALHFRPGTPASSEPNLVRLVRALVASGGARYTLYARTDNWRSFELPRGSVRIVRFPGALCRLVPIRVCFELLLVPILARFAGIRVLHYTGSTAPLFRFSRVVATLYWVPTPLLLRTFSPLKRLYFTKLYRHALAGCDRVVTITEAAKRAGIETLGLDPTRLGVAPLGVEPRFFEAHAKGEMAEVRARYRLPPRYLVTVTSDAPYKNFGQLVSAFGRLRDNYEGGLVVIGNVRRTAVASSEVAAHIVLLGYVPYGDVPMIMSGADAMIYVSLQETFGLAILEAMATGIPVVATDIPPLREVAGDAALLVPSEAPEEITLAVARILRDPALSAELHERGVRRAREFTWTAAAKRIEAIYRDVLRVPESPVRT